MSNPTSSQPHQPVGRADLAAALSDIYREMVRAAAVESRVRAEAGFSDATSQFEWRLERAVTHAKVAIGQTHDLGIDGGPIVDESAADQIAIELPQLDAQIVAADRRDQRDDLIMVRTHAVAAAAARRARTVLDRLITEHGYTHEILPSVWADLDDRIDRIATSIRVNLSEAQRPNFREIVHSDWLDATAGTDHELIDSAAAQTTAATAGDHEIEAADLFDRLVNADRIEALTLGIDGCDPESNQRRADLARQMIEENTRRSERAYARAHWTSEPNVPDPFGLPLVNQHDGDLAAVVADTGFDWAVSQSMGVGYHRTEFVHDEDGQRYVTIEPTPEETAELRAETSRIVQRIEDMDDYETYSDQGPDHVDDEAVEDWFVSAPVERIDRFDDRPAVDGRPAATPDNANDNPRAAQTHDRDRRDDIAAQTTIDTGYDTDEDDHTAGPASMAHRPTAADRARTVDTRLMATATAVLSPPNPDTIQAEALDVTDREYSDAELMARIDAAIAAGDMWVFDPNAETDHVDEPAELNDPVHNTGDSIRRIETADTDTAEVGRRAQEAIREVQSRQADHEAEQQAQDDDLDRWHTDDTAATLEQQHHDEHSATYGD